LRKLNFKILLIFLFLLVFGRTEIFSQNEQNKDTSKYTFFLPDYVKLQFAGGIGFLSLGVGYTFFRQKLDVSYFYSYIPKKISSDDLHSVSLQFTTKLLRIKINKNINLLPLNIGWFIHHTFGEEYWIKLPSHYPNDYYWWSPGRNAGVFVGGEIKTKLLSNKTPASGTAFYFRIGSRGLYIASKFKNSSIPLDEIIELGFGIAVYR